MSGVGYVLIAVEASKMLSGTKQSGTVAASCRDLSCHLQATRQSLPGSMAAQQYQNSRCQHNMHHDQCLLQTWQELAKWHTHCTTWHVVASCSAEFFFCRTLHSDWIAGSLATLAYRGYRRRLLHLVNASQTYWHHDHGTIEQYGCNWHVQQQSV